MIQHQNDLEPGRRTDGRTRLFVITWLLTIVSAAVSTGFSVAALVETAGDGPSGAPDELAMYAASRSIALLLAAVGVGFLRSPRALVVVTLAMTVVQALDAVVGALAGDPLTTWGPAGTAAATLVAAVLLIREERSQGS